MVHSGSVDMTYLCFGKVQGALKPQQATTHLVATMQSKVLIPIAVLSANRRRQVREGVVILIHVRRRALDIAPEPLVIRYKKVTKKV